MDIGRLGFQYTPAGAALAAPAPATPVAPKTSPAPEAGAESTPFDFPPAPATELRFNQDRLEFFNQNYSDSRALLALKIEPPDYTQAGASQHELGGVRSPFLQKQAQTLGKALIQTPLKEAWKSREWDSTSVRAVGLGVGALAAAICAPTEVKSRLTLHQTEVGDYKLKSGLGIVTGYGDVALAGAKISLSPNSRSGSNFGPSPKKDWNLDLEYKPQDDRIGLAYQRSVSRVNVGPSEGVSYLRAGLSSDRKQGTLGHLTYNLNY